jgi:hypothetical protein
MIRRRGKEEGANGEDPLVVKHEGIGAFAASLELSAFLASGMRDVVVYFILWLGVVLRLLWLLPRRCARAG